MNCKVLDIHDIIQELEEEYENERKKTAWYLNTANCRLEGFKDELDDMKKVVIEEGGYGCYIGGRIEVLEKIKEIIYEKSISE